MFTFYVVYGVTKARKVGKVGNWGSLLGKPGRLEQVRLANQLQGFRIPDYIILHHRSTQIEITINDRLVTRAHFLVYNNVKVYIEKRYHLFYNPCCKLWQHVTLIKTPVYIAQHVGRSSSIIGNTRNNALPVACFTSVCHYRLPSSPVHVVFEAGTPSPASLKAHTSIVYFVALCSCVRTSE